MILWNENWNVTWDQINRPSSQATNQPYKPIANKHCATSQTTWQRSILPSKYLQAKQSEVEPTLYTNLPNDKECYSHGHYRMPTNQCTHHCCFISVVCPRLEILRMFIVCGIIQFTFCNHWRSAGHLFVIADAVVVHVAQGGSYQVV